jgi:hypothetical protein
MIILMIGTMRVDEIDDESAGGWLFVCVGV